MDNKPFELEFLPNEILLILFQYLDARDLFRIFFNLNTRFNHLLLSPNHLSLTISKYNDIKNEQNNRFICYIHDLIIQDKINIDFTRFTVLHSLILMHATYQQIQQLDNTILPYLKYLSIRKVDSSLSTDLSDIYNKLFSNHFSYLQSCYLPDGMIVKGPAQWMQIPSLRILEVGLINLFVYKSILSSCPNLYSLKFIICFEKEIPSDMKPHLNIKRLILNNDSLLQHWDTPLIGTYLSCVPNLEQLYLRRHIFRSNIKNCLVNNDWYTSLISSYLLRLRRFQFCLHVVELGDVNIDNIVRQLVEDFQSTPNARYESWFVIEFSQMPNPLSIIIPA